jgi:hypothetical protein
MHKYLQAADLKKGLYYKILVKLSNKIFLDLFIKHGKITVQCQGVYGLKKSYFTIFYILFHIRFFVVSQNKVNVQCMGKPAGLRG